ncbi:hypothetical protein J416_14223 [Gracilibacillus halophilus YIM-C55.5]|uniref:tRNA (guanine-N(7)-)-methyltransferase n=1 Tax=Gracilibacillus halophilus YIM-C55.5 TaxID=1308866 RepID=N4W6F5_9BACI|nr:tRNA (guanosine(46)-N7)-methyltransferase TrmB [Gracilibacillus halophilus]ENH95798.1 hypothetical protein J416_14223 [Gracilibacillus halophilus YIM-C55.5]
MRARYKPWAADFIKENTDIVLPEPSQYFGKWREYFSNDAPLHLEIGTGKGQFIKGMAKQYPNDNFVGIEIVESIIVSAVQKIKKKQLSNVRLLNEDAMDLTSIFAENEIDMIYLNFSDPWPKNRHEKRRLTFPYFLKQYQQLLKPEGKVVLKTDNRGFFEYSLASMSQYGCIFDEVSLDLHELEDPTNVMTEYEEKFAAKGQPIYRLIAHIPK